MSYSKLSTAFQNKQEFKYNKELVCDGTKIIATNHKWEYCKVANRWIKSQNTNIVLAEHIEHKGKSYAVVYNRGNKCFATEVLAYGFNNKWVRPKLGNLQYGELGIPPKEMQRAYRSQMIDALIYGGAITHILIPTTLEGDSAFFKLLEG